MVICMWFVCKLCGEVIVDSEYGSLFNRIREHYMTEHDFDLHSANFIARDLIRKVIEEDERYNQANP